MAADGNPYEAVAKLYQALFTGIVLFTASRKGAQAAGDITRATFRFQHKEKFLSSFDKLGLAGEPHAVACARYHYLSNGIGGVPTEYMYENDRKAWVRFRHPRWMYEGAALAGMPLEVSHGFLRGWYAQNGKSLKNPRLGFVCTSQDMDGQFGLCGYFREYDHDLSDDERLVFAPGETAPAFDPTALSGLDTSEWPEERLQKANRNYAMEYIRSILPEMAGLFGPMDTIYLAGGAAQIIGKQYYTETAQRLGIEPGGAEGFARLMQRFGEAAGDDIEVAMEGGTAHVTQRGWRLMRDRGPLHSSVFDAWNGLWHGLLSMHDRFLALEVLSRMDYGDESFTWRVRPKTVSRI